MSELTKGRKFYIGVDVGSTTVKCVVVDPASHDIVWSRYERHLTHQAEKVAEMLGDIEADFPQISRRDMRVFITGSGASLIADHIGARFVQEVNAVAIALERLHPDARSVVELGGQDAKVIIIKDVPETGEKSIITSMNDKCASGTGATIDKCLLKVGMSQDDLAGLRFDEDKIHHVAARCGVFAETDVVNLIKAGVPPDEVMNSLADAIVTQNLSVLTRGNTLREKVLLLGGPNTFLPVLKECWRRRIPETWAERGHVIPDTPVDDLIVVPPNAQYYAAAGAAIFGMEEADDAGVYLGLEGLQAYITHGRKARLGQTAGPPLLSDGESLDAFAKRYSVPEFAPRDLGRGTVVRGYIGFDGGSTTSKAVLIDEDGEVLAKEYLISLGNPIQDAREILARLRDYATDQGCSLEILGFGATGYAADVLDSALKCDANVVETVAHMLSAKRYLGGDIDVVCDIGGQDIKVLFLKHGVVRSFRLSNQCSAGNGMLLQAMADQFGVDLCDYADIAFDAELSPKFSYGCAVFLDTDRVNYQREGFTREELFAGLAMVLPKNIWQYVVQIPRLAKLGRRFVLQGGTQRNLAAVKAQVDYIVERVPEAKVVIHPHCGEAGAIGAALEAWRMVGRRGGSRFIGLDAAIALEYTRRTDETTRCGFCQNQCLRTFIDTTTPNGDTTRYIAGFSCEKGTVESKEAVVQLNRERKRLMAEYPNLVDYESSLAFRRFYDVAPQPEDGSPFEDIAVTRAFFGCGPVRRKRVTRPFVRSCEAARTRRESIRIGVPRVLIHYAVAPFLRTYLEALGIRSRSVVFSDETSEDLWLGGSKYGAIDPCYPSKVALGHIHNLISVKHARKPLDFIWFPSITHMPTFVTHTVGSNNCPIVAGTPSVIAAAYTKEKDVFAGAGIEHVRQALNFEIPHLLRRQLFETWGERLGVTEDESDWACEQAWAAMALCDDDLQRRGLEMLADAEENNKVVLLMIGRPYHNDIGFNHGVLEEFQALGYPVLSMRAIPKDRAYLERFFKDDLERGLIADVFDLRDVWPENYSTTSAQKVWAAKFAARHPNIAVVDLSSFKCGHDAPTYGMIDNILAASKTPHLSLHDLDANKPGGSILIRVKTFAYTLSLYEDHLVEAAAKGDQLARSLAAKRIELVAKYRKQLDQHIRAASPQTREGLQAAFDNYLNKDRVALDDDYTVDGSQPASSADAPIAENMTAAETRTAAE
jgi:activator of 2-hydroxyglutaryl-CoA dehydratase/predicted nucleotide-binding protein (sugar kinase/HSP70/actin superfamily)